MKLISQPTFSKSKPFSWVIKQAGTPFFYGKDGAWIHRDGKARKFPSEEAADAFIATLTAQNNG